MLAISTVNTYKGYQFILDLAQNPPEMWESRKNGMFFAINHKFGSQRFSYNVQFTNFMSSFDCKIPKLEKKNLC